MGAHVLRLDGGRAIVRVMYLTDGVPPARAWFEVSEPDGGVRELDYADVQAIESVWR